MRGRQIAFWLLYGLVKPPFRWLLRIAFRVQVQGADRVPGAGGLLVVSNHISHLDPPVLGLFFPRPVDWMGMIELFRRPWLAAMMRVFQVFPVDRSKGDTTAVREAARRLRAGHCVVIFPEGGIRVGEESAVHGSGVLKEGAVAIARIAHVPIQPVVLEGTRAGYDWRNWFFRRPVMRIAFGEPFHLEKHESREDATEKLRERMVQLAGPSRQLHSS